MDVHPTKNVSIGIDPYPDGFRMVSDLQNRLRLIYDATWADPQHEKGLGPNDRGGDAVSFGPDAWRDGAC